MAGSIAAPAPVLLVQEIGRRQLCCRCSLAVCSWGVRANNDQPPSLLEEARGVATDGAPGDGRSESGRGGPGQVAGRLFRVSVLALALRWLFRHGQSLAAIELLRNRSGDEGS